MLLKLPALLLVLPLLVSTEAGATGGFSCEVKDKSVAFEVSAATSRGMGGAILEPSGKMTLNLQNLPEDMRSFDLAQALVHHWLADGALKLHYYVERQGDKAFGSAELIVDTKATGDDETTKGRYLVSIFMTDPATSESKMQEIKGRVTCLVE